MRHYECTFILDPTLPDDDLGSLSERFRQVVLNQGGSVDTLERWERRRLAYEVKGKREGVYYVMNFTADPGAETELGRVLRLTDGVLRHIVVRLDEKARQHMQAQAALRAQQAEAAAAAQAEAAAQAAAQAAAAAAEEPAPTPPAEPETTAPPTTEPVTDEATPEPVAASEESETEER